MANINSEKAKLIFTVISNKKTHNIRTQSVFDNRTQEYWTTEYYVKKGPSSGLYTSWFVYVFD